MLDIPLAFYNDGPDHGSSFVRTVTALHANSQLNSINYTVSTTQGSEPRGAHFWNRKLKTVKSTGTYFNT